jgi:predicted nucleic acid-binding protein
MVPTRYAVESSILVAALAEREAHHGTCSALIRSACVIYIHALSETFSTLTGGRLVIRLGAAEVAHLIEETVLPFAQVATLSTAGMIGALREAETRGVRGGAIYDFLHLVAARDKNVERLYTLNVRHFRAFWRPGDPEVVHPRDATKLQPPEQTGAS